MKPITIESESEVSPLEKASMLIASDPDSLAAEERILDLFMRQRKSILLTGKAGTGKTTLIASIVYKLKKQLAMEHKECVSVEVTALTGLAGMMIPGGIGRTMHSALGLKINKTRKDMIDSVTWKKRKEISKIGYLIIDEVSMLSAELLTEIDAFLRVVRKRDYFMGGIPTLFSGDFLQLPPVSKDTKEMFAFQANVFVQNVLPNTVYLSTTRRQSEGDFLKILNEVRIGLCSPESCAVLHTRNIELYKDEIEKSAVKPTRLYSINKNVDVENSRELEKLPGEKRVYTAVHCSGKQDPKSKIVKYTELAPTSQSEIEEVSKFFDSNTLVPKTLELKVGAQVMYLRSNPMSPLRNGSRGVVVRFDMKCGGMPVVDFIGVGEVLLIPEDIDRVTGDPGSPKYYSRRQIPIKLAWALTIHKSQGMTLDTVIVFFPDSFCPAQIYVALSRVKTLAGLYIVRFDPKKIVADKVVLAFYACLDEDVKQSCVERKISLEYMIFEGPGMSMQKPKRMSTQKDDDDNDEPKKGGWRAHRAKTE